MAYTTINKSTDHFNTITYTGNAASTRAITGVGFQPDLLWIKNRDDGTRYHVLADVVRGANGSGAMNLIYPNDSQAQNTTDTANIKSLDSDGFTVGSDNNVNKNSAGQVAWNWKAGGGQGSSNTDGSINTTYTSVNTTAGFSISQWNGNGNASATVGHGLGVTPKFIISKAISASPPEGGWFVMHSDLPDGENLRLNASHGQYSTSQFSQGLIKESATTNQVFGFQAGGSGVENVNSNGVTYITYCFAEIPGYSKIGSYDGNGNGNGTFVFCGFKPTFILIKNKSASTDWHLFDSTRGGPASNIFGNPNKYFLKPNESDAEGNETFDIYSNGFKPRITNNFLNGSGDTLIYIAFGQTLVGSNNVPCTAR